MSKKRRIWDGILDGLTNLSALVAVIVLGMIFVFIFQRGLSTLSFDLLKENYWKASYLAEVKSSTEQFERPAGIDESYVFSERYGIAFADDVTREKEAVVLVKYLDENSPFNQMLNMTAGENFQAPLELFINSNFSKFNYYDADGNYKGIGSFYNQSAEAIVEILDSGQVDQAVQLFYLTSGGGVRGSLLATLMLIGISLVIAMPIGIAAAIYLNEYANDNRLTRLMRSSIEMLSGVPSIIFGLMGVSVLFPITSLFNIRGTSVLLGALTLAIMLLPIVIRQTEESLKVVPMGYRSASLSLGATKTQTIFKVILPNALVGILSAILLSISRIIGESAALIYTMGTFINDYPAWNQAGTSLAVQIWSIMSGEQPNFELASAISIIILVMVLALNISVKLISHQINKKWSVT